LLKRDRELSGGIISFCSSDNLSSRQVISATAAHRNVVALSRQQSWEIPTKRISPSYIERQNLTMRMMNRRFTRLTNACSKKIENHRHSSALDFMHYNFCRIHKTLRVTPAMEAGISSRIWSIEDLASLAN
jgi:hypothetical protein